MDILLESYQIVCFQKTIHTHQVFSQDSVSGHSVTNMGWNHPSRGSGGMHSENFGSHHTVITIVNNVEQHVQVFRKLVLYVTTSKRSPVGILLTGLLVSGYRTFLSVKSVQ